MLCARFDSGVCCVELCYVPDLIVVFADSVELCSVPDLIVVFADSVELCFCTRFAAVHCQCLTKTSA